MSAPPPRRSTLALTLRSLLAAGWFAFVFFALFPALVLWASGAGPWPPAGATLWLGVALVALAHVAIARLVADFVREGRGTQAPFDPPRRFVASGPYRRVRNPMYLLYAVVALGEAIAYRSPALLAYVLTFFALMHVYVVKVEEPGLARRFGDAYRRYCRRVPRWLPRLRGERRGSL